MNLSNDMLCVWRYQKLQIVPSSRVTSRASEGKPTRFLRIFGKNFSWRKERKNPEGKFKSFYKKW